MMQDSVYSGIRFPKETLKKLDRHKGYYSRNRFLLKITEEYLTELEKTHSNKKTTGAEGAMMCNQSAPPNTIDVTTGRTATTNTHDGGPRF